MFFLEGKKHPVELTLMVPEKWWGIEVPDPFVMVSGVTRLNVDIKECSILLADFGPEHSSLLKLSFDLLFS